MSDQHGPQPAHGQDDHDSAGVPWGGRTLPAGGFEGDDGAPDPGLVAALVARAADPSPTTDLALTRAAAAARWLVPVVAVAGDVEEGGGGLTVEKFTDMAVVTLTGPDGRRALPVFTGTAALAAWDPAARPVPVPADRAAQAAVAEGCDVVVVDLAGGGGAPATELRPSQVWALAQRRGWLPAHEDPFVRAAVEAAVRAEDAVEEADLQDGAPAGSGTLRVVLALRPGLDQDAVAALATRVGERLAADGELRARVDGLAFALRPATGS